MALQRYLWLVSPGNTASQELRGLGISALGWYLNKIACSLHMNYQNNRLFSKNLESV